MAVDLFAGISVSDLDRSLHWYERLLGAQPSFRPNDVEAVWEVAEHRYLYVALRPAHAGSGLVTLFVDDLDQRVTAMAGRGIEAAERETYDNGVRKVTYRDPDGNEIGFGGGPVDAT
jgi:catechol 2,3-dioxygenase-like lactoylglutathione lyase family enzyme